MDERPILTKLGILTIQLERSVVHLLSRRPFYQYVIIVTRSLEVDQINCRLNGRGSRRKKPGYGHHTHGADNADSSDQAEGTVHVADPVIVTVQPKANTSP